MITKTEARKIQGLRVLFSALAHLTIESGPNLFSSMLILNQATCQIMYDLDIPDKGIVDGKFQFGHSASLQEKY